MGQAYEQVKQGSCADPGIFVRGGGGGKGVEAPRPEYSLDNVFLVSSPQLILQFTEGIQWFSYLVTDLGSNIFQEGWSNFFQGVGTQRNPYTL